MTKETVNIFEKASRIKLRFDTPIGNLGVEDLWTLPLSSTNGKPNLDSIAVALSKSLKGTEDSFVSNTKRDELLQLKFDVVKHMIDTLMREKTEKTEQVQRDAKRQRIAEILASREDEELTGLSSDELRELQKTL